MTPAHAARGAACSDLRWRRFGVVFGVAGMKAGELYNIKPDLAILYFVGLLEIMLQLWSTLIKLS